MSGKFVSLYLLLITMFFLSCKKQDVEIYGYKPVYINNDSLYDIKNINPQSLDSTGLIYRWNQYLLINEHLKGVHVIDVSNPSNPINTSFINIPGNTLFSIGSDSFLYADNRFDLLTIDIHNILEVELVDIDYNTFLSTPILPKNVQNIGFRRNTTYIECIDESKGRIIDWKYDKLINPQCKL